MILSKLQEVLAGLPADVRQPSTPAETAQLMAALARLEAEPLPKTDCAAPRSLEALRLEDPAAMSGCWNPGCAAALAMAGCWGAHENYKMFHALACTPGGRPPE